MDFFSMHFVEIISYKAFPIEQLIQIILQQAQFPAIISAHVSLPSSG